MRLTPAQIDTIKSTAQEVLGQGVQVTLFGSRVHDDQKGGDVDLMVEVLQAVQEPALMAARLASRVSRSMHGRKVDVLLKAPNLLEQPIHRIASQEGVRLSALPLRSMSALLFFADWPKNDGPGQSLAFEIGFLSARRQFPTVIGK